MKPPFERIIVIASFTRQEDAERYAKESVLAEIHRLQVREVTIHPDAVARGHRLFQVYYEEIET